MEKLPTRPNKFDIDSVQQFHKPLNLDENLFHFTKVSEKTILDFLKKLKTYKATAIDNWSFSERQVKSLISPYSINMQSLYQTLYGPW